MDKTASDINILENDDLLFEQVMENNSRRGGGSGDSVMGAYRDKLKMVLDRVDSNPTMPVKQLKAGAVANALKGLFVSVDENNRYGRSYRYLRQMGQNLKNWGWELKDVGGIQMIVKITGAAATPVKETKETKETKDKAEKVAATA